MPKTAALATDDKAFAYDEVPYESFSYSHTHPQNLGMIGTLFGMAPADFKTARVLELGCAAGGNILPLASIYPEATFMGIDLSKAQIEEGQADIKALGLKNIKLEQMDIINFPSSAGEFDYIICHGIYSWVPAGVQDGILDIFQRHLSAQGIAMVSYNCLPGWSVVRGLREMMLFHTSRFQNPKDKITQAKAFLDFVHDNTPASNTAYKQVIDTERQTLKKANDSYLFHDHLEQNNTPFYLHEVVGKAAGKGLQYVGDTSVPAMFIGNLPAEAAAKLGAINNIVLQEQYMDFLNNRRFRNSIFTRAETKVDRNLKGSVSLDLSVKALYKPLTENPDIAKPIQFERANPKAGFNSADKATSALLLELAKSFKPLLVREVIKCAAAAYSISEAELEVAASKNLTRLFLSGFINFYGESPKTPETMPDKPKVYRFGRFLAEKKGLRYITNMMGESIPVDRHGVEVIKLADGTRSVAEIAEGFEAYITKSGDSILDKGVAVTDPAARKAAVEKLTNNILNGLLRGCALMA